MGYILMMNGGPISWTTWRQDNVSVSTSEAEFFVARQAGPEAIYLLATITDFGYSQTESTIHYEDNLACVAMSGAPEILSSYRHLTILRARTRPSWASQDRAFAHLQNSGRRPRQEFAVTGIRRAPTDHDWSPSLLRSPPALLRGLILSADFERCVFILFLLIIYNFFPRLLRCVQSFCELHLVCSASLFINLFFMFSQFFVFFNLPNTVSLRSHYCAFGREIYRPRTRSAAVRQVSNANERDLDTNANV